MDTETANRAIKDGSLAKTMGSALDQIKPEAAYFTTFDGDRTAYLFFDMQETAQMPSMAEPFFIGLDAKVDWFPVMNRDELQEGLSRLQR